ncbi:MAG: flagellar basal-body rod protein FlgF [Pseudomonadota bacterium]
MQAFFNGLSGLFAFSKGLDNVSNNVSNMNTPGYRGSDTFYRSVSDASGQGYGAGIAGTEVRTTPGETRQTGNDTDLAIKGAGYFVLRSEQGAYFYTRAGQFQIDKDGFLVDAVTQLNVLGIDSSGSLSDISIQDKRSLPPTPTSRVELLGSLARTGPADSNHIIQSVQVFDRTGVKQSLQLSFEPKSDSLNSWKVEVTNSEGVTIHTGEIAFSPDGSPAEGANTLIFTLTTHGAAQTIVLDFGKPGIFNQAYQVSSSVNHTLSARVTDGSAVAGLTSFSFDETGIVRFTYSNGEKRDGSQIALADFPDETVLLPSKNSLYTAPASSPPVYGRASDAQFGRIQGGYIELSNVDLAQEFGDILIIQRGYQASSRVMTVSNELLEQLYNSTRGG